MNGQKINKEILPVKNVEFIKQCISQRKCFASKHFGKTSAICRTCKYFKKCKSTIEKYGVMNKWKLKQIQEDKK